MVYRYGTFLRPLWIGFDAGIKYRIVPMRESDIINGRKPHDVIETDERLSPEKIYNLQLTDYEEVEEKRKLFKYAETKFSGRNLQLVDDLIQKGTIKDKAKIDFYFNKLKKE